MSATIRHPKLGEVNGKAGNGVTQFLGVKYAELKDRFAEPAVVTKYAGGGVDATNFGPTVLCPPHGCDMEHGFIQQTLAKPAEPPASDLDGLNLNITVPAGQAGGLPVLVFIHGGGFFIGGSWWPQYDLARLVKLSKERGSPIIGVGINYRLGIPGFLTSEELRQAGIKPNNGLRDQAAALRWIKENIGGFGGDPDNVTVLGESAGSVSTLTHLFSPTPLFRRIVSLSGTPLAMKPLAPAVADGVYAGVTAALGLSDLSPAERIERLAAMPAAELTSKVPPGLPMLPVVDGETVGEALAYEGLGERLAAWGGAAWCSEVMIGWCSFDANIFTYLAPVFATPNLAAAFTTSLTSSLTAHPSLAARLLQTYAITPSSPDADALTSILHLGTAIYFGAPARSYAAAWSGFGKNAYLYHFAAANPWDGRDKGRATHILDVAFLFQNYNEKLSAEQRDVAVAFAEDVVGFVNGKGAGWRAYGADGGQVGVYGEERAGAARALRGRGEEEGDDVLATVLREEGVGLDVVNAAWDNFMQGK